MQANFKDSPVLVYDTIINNFNKADRYNILELALGSTRNLKSIIESSRQQLDDIKNDDRMFTIKYHEKFTLSSVLIVLFLIAAPLGTIIRKGGIGMPMVVSIIMFILYYVINMIGIKMGKEGIVPEWIGAWLATMILFPVGLFVLNRAANESAIFDREKYQKLLEKLRIKLFNKA